MKYLLKKEVRSNRVVFQSTNKLLQAQLADQKKKAAIMNKGISPDLSSNYRCKTCGTIGKNHPETGYCFICDTDNWSN